MVHWHVMLLERLQNIVKSAVKMDSTLPTILLPRTYVTRENGCHTPSICLFHGQTAQVVASNFIAT